MIDATRFTVEPSQIRQDLPIISAAHSAVRAGLEKARIGKSLGSSLQSSIYISAEDEEAVTVLKRYEDELDAIFVVSSVDINKSLPSDPAWTYTEEFELGSSKAVIHVLPPEQHKCLRCWRYVAQEEDSICGRCEDIVAAIEPNVQKV